MTAEGCRDPLSVWPTADGPPILLDGHNRYRICSANNLPFDVVAVSLESREDTIRWIINNQLGRRNLTELQKSKLRGRRFELEKKAEGRPPEQLPKSLGVSQPEGETAERLAKELHVSRGTIENDGAFIKGLDALKTIREDLPKSIITKRSHQATKGKGQPKVTKARLITVGKLIHELKLTPPPYMRSGDWQDFHILEALPLLAEIPLAEHGDVTALLSTPPLPPALSLQILKDLLARGAHRASPHALSPTGFTRSIRQGIHGQSTTSTSPSWWRISHRLRSPSRQKRKVSRALPTFSPSSCTSGSQRGSVG